MFMVLLPNERFLQMMLNLSLKNNKKSSLLFTQVLYKIFVLKPLQMCSLSIFAIL